MIENRYAVGRVFYVHAPPFKGRRSKTTGEFLSKRLARIKQPFVGAEPWQCSIYYFWWEFLRRHEGYKDCCLRGGKGQYRQLFKDFGDIHACGVEDFWAWWTTKRDDGLKRGEYLFAEPPARQLRATDGVLNTQTTDTLLVEIPLEVRTPQLVKMFRKMLQDHSSEVRSARKISRARYPVATSVPLHTLHLSLRALDTWNEHLHRKKKYEQCDIAGIYVNEVVHGETIAKLMRADLPYKDVEREVRRRKTQAFNRYLTAAQEYVEYASIGSFPRRG
ncbi:hypothetical protein L0666_06550 [Octadecabacter sp. CECT 8868]|uniref:hypothetical protein n=1 Tax=Octadecabacter algicola TaxID=2909342 RepID=UPI001F361A48|nr:hypothetical protein [Octadecabacter algicola]MCF2904639.1 hypothetical protein [Octadecabacter algicola]